MRRVIGKDSFSLAFFRALMLLMAVVGTVQAVSAQAGSGAPGLVSEAGYERLLDAIFPRENIASLKVAYTMVLRFQPNEGAESQLLFRVWYDGHTDAELYMVKGGSAWASANNYLAKSGKEEIANIVRLIPVERKQLSISTREVQEWHAGLFDTLRSSDSALQKAAAEYAKNGSREAVLDGTRYQFWYLQGETETRWNFSDIDINDGAPRANLPLARWMKMVRASSLRKR
jgi:hypothetical protein